jgi:hypothetical protein
LLDVASVLGGGLKEWNAETVSEFLRGYHMLVIVLGCDMIQSSLVILNR